jgi:hypothetical protein
MILCSTKWLKPVAHIVNRSIQAVSRKEQAINFFSSEAYKGW